MNIKYFCFNQSSTDSGSSELSDHCLDAQYGGYDVINAGYSHYQSQIITIDPNSTSQEGYVYVNDKDEEWFSYVCIPGQFVFIFVCKYGH